MRSRNEKEVAELAQLVAELTGRGDNLSRRAELAEGLGGNGVCNQQSDAVVRDEDDSPETIEFITENGFSISRPWESRQLPAPANGTCRFGVSDGFIEQEVTVEISPRVIAEIALRTRGRIQRSSTFWICCAERHLANYVSEHEEIPERNELMVASLDREDILLAIRWNRSDEE
jgi:hypothetical protein